VIKALFALLLISSNAIGTEQPVTTSCPTVPVPGHFTPVVFRPPVNPIMEAGLKTRMRSVEGIVLLKHDANGNVTDATFEKSSGNKRVDAAILKWAQGVKMQPGACGFSKVSAGFSMSS
jgi:TonB family protein